MSTSGSIGPGGGGGAAHHGPGRHRTGWVKDLVQVAGKGWIEGLVLGQGQLGQGHLQGLGPFDCLADEMMATAEGQAFAHQVVGQVGGQQAAVQGVCHQEANRTWKAVECFDDQLKLARQLGDQETEAQALWSAARAVRSLGRLPDAITRISAALAILESINPEEAEKARADLERWRSSKG